MILILGMTNANMKLVTLEVLLDNSLELPEQKLEKGEFIIIRVVELAKLSEELKGNAFLLSVPLQESMVFCIDYDKKVCHLLVKRLLLILRRALWSTLVYPILHLVTKWHNRFQEEDKKCIQ